MKIRISSGSLGRFLMVDAETKEGATATLAVCSA
jgi:hypothetical protein